MSSAREGPNPLRPYAVPPSVALPPGGLPGNGSTSKSRATASASARPAPSSSKPGYRSAAREMLSELDYADYIGEASPSMVEVLKNLMDQGVWRYTSVVMAQPFDVAKTILQVQDAGAVVDSGKEKQKASSLRRKASYGRDSYDYLPEDSDNDSQSYFTSTAPNSQKLPGSARQRYASSRSPSPSSPGHDAAPPPAEYGHMRNLPSTSSVTTALSTLWKHEGAWGVWKGTNSTFIHSVLLSTITAFLRSLLCAVLAIPDPGLSAAVPALAGPSTVAALDIVSSPAPLLSLLASVTASGIAGIILSPIDIARTMLMLTPTTHQPRSILPALKTLQSWFLPASIAPVTLLHSTLPTLISASTPLILRANLGIDPILTPSTYAVATFASQAFELGLRLPIETVLRRGQLAIVGAQNAATSSSSSSTSTRHSTPSSSRLINNASSSSSSLPNSTAPLVTIVDVGAYKGLLGTMYHIIFEEGTRRRTPTTTSDEKKKQATQLNTLAPPSPPSSKRKGQGLEGLWRGWRVGIWGLVGCWGAATLGGGAGKGAEF